MIEFRMTKLKLIHIVTFVTNRVVDNERLKTSLKNIVVNLNLVKTDLTTLLYYCGFVFDAVFNHKDVTEYLLKLRESKDARMEDDFKYLKNHLKETLIELKHRDKEKLSIEELDDIVDLFEEILDNMHGEYKKYDPLLYSVFNKVLTDGNSSNNKLINNPSTESSVYKDGNIVPSLVVAELDKHFIGQDNVKKQLAVFAASHYNSICKDDAGFYKQSILIVGETGTGKTLAVKSLGRVLNKPVHIVDITEYSKTGYIGKNIGDLLSEIQSANYSVPPIVFIDEFDKISGYGQETKGGSNVMDDSVQNNLLKLVEGDANKMVTSGKGLNEQVKAMDTHKICFIFGGSFQKLLEDKKQKEISKGTSTIGFDKKKVDKKDIGKIELTHNDIVEAGIKRELVGRIGMIVQTDPLTEDMWMDIMTKPQACIKAHFNRLFKDSGIDDEVTTKDLKAIIKQAKGTDLGARGLWAIAGTYFAKRLYH